MTERTRHRFTIRELAAEAARHLASSEVDQTSGRVSDVPSSRTIRYYASHGLLGAPVDWEGRTAIYGRRHLMQLVAIKRLQAKGYALSEIQKRMHGVSSEELEQIAQLAELEVDDAPERPSNSKGSSRSQRAFWKERGARVDTQAPVVRAEEEVGALRLDDEVLLVIEGLARTLEADDRHALKVAAEPLVHLLKARRLIGSSTQEGGQDE